jgi:DNA polymerase I-like protein with 3'-5' exonuclease and polymerase domains
MRTIFFDLECTVEGGVKGDSPEAQWVANDCLLAGWREHDGTVWKAQWEGSLLELCRYIASASSKEKVLLVAHNAKFDLKWLLRMNNNIAFDKIQWRNVEVWDTMTYEYLVSGHLLKFQSLEAACALRGIHAKKTLDLGAYLDAGLKMQDIPYEDLKQYLRNDVELLIQLWEAQQLDGYDPDMDYILPLADMELNGLRVDVPAAQQLMTRLAAKVGTAEKIVEHYIVARCQWQDGTRITPADFDPTYSPKGKTIKPMGARTLSFLLTGVPKTVKVSGKWELEFYGGATPALHPQEVLEIWGTEKPTHLGYSMAESKLDEVLNRLSDDPHLMVYSTMQHRSDNKILATYLSPMLEQAAIQGCIYPKLNTTVTNTGRLSSSSPNGQNMPGMVRNLIMPHNSEYEMCEIDFDQLEMMGAACVSGDTALIQTLASGVDTHYITGKSVMGWQSPSDMTKEDRTKVKNVNFGILYGGKAGGLSKQTGVPVNLVKQLIKSFYDRFPQVKSCQ